MAIRKMSADMFEAIAENKAIKEETFELTAEQAEDLFDAGIEELKHNALLFNIFVSGIEKSAFGFALLETPYTEEGQSVYIQVRKRQLEAVVIQTPFYKR